MRPGVPWPGETHMSAPPPCVGHQLWAAPFHPFLTARLWLTPLFYFPNTARCARVILKVTDVNNTYVLVYGLGSLEKETTQAPETQPY